MDTCYNHPSEAMAALVSDEGMLTAYGDVIALGKVSNEPTYVSMWINGRQ